MVFFFLGFFLYCICVCCICQHVIFLSAWFLIQFLPPSCLVIVVFPVSTCSLFRSCVFVQVHSLVHCIYMFISCNSRIQTNTHKPSIIASLQTNISKLPSLSTLHTLYKAYSYCICKSIFLNYSMVIQIDAKVLMISGWWVEQLHMPQWGDVHNWKLWRLNVTSCNLEIIIIFLLGLFYAAEHRLRDPKCTYKHPYIIKALLWHVAATTMCHTEVYMHIYSRHKQK